jgi:hypothetical protein
VKPFQIETRRLGRAFVASGGRRTAIVGLWAVLWWVLVFANARGIQAAEAAAPPTHLVSPSESLRNEREVLKYLWPALDYGEKVGRVYYSAACQLDPNVAAAFPRLDVRPPSNGKTGVAAIREIFRNEKDVSVKETDSGIIRVRIGSVPDAVLRVKISNLALSPEEQYNYWLAIFKIQDAQEVRFAMQELGIRVPVRVTNMLIVQPAVGLPHLPGEIKNVTMDQALDLVAKTFKGIVVYQFCTPPAQYEIDFASASWIYSTR